MVSILVKMNLEGSCNSYRFRLYARRLTTCFWTATECANAHPTRSRKRQNIFLYYIILNCWTIINWWGCFYVAVEHSAGVTMKMWHKIAWCCCVVLLLRNGGFLLWYYCYRQYIIIYTYYDSRRWNRIWNHITHHIYLKNHFILVVLRKKKL